MDAPATAVRRHWLWPTRRRFVIGTLIGLAIWGWVDVRVRGRIDPQDHWGHKTDFTVYTEAGAAFFDGRDPYTVTNPRGWGYLYPPLFAILVSPLHEIDSSHQVLVWFAISLAAAWGCYLELKRIGRLVLPELPVEGTFGRIPTWLGTIAVCAATIPALNCLQRGQVGVAKLYLLLLGFRLLLDNRAVLKPLSGAVLLALAVTLKITPIVPACVLLAQELASAFFAPSKPRWRAAGASSFGFAAGLALWLLLVPAAFVGWQSNLDHLHTWWGAVAMRAESTSEDDFAGNSTTVRNQSLANAAYRLGNWAHYQFAGGPDDNGPEQLRRGGHGLLMDAPWIERAILGVRVLAGLMMLAVAFRMARLQDPLGLATSFGMACAATLVVFTIARGHYYVLLLPANIFAPLWLLRAGRRRWAISLAILPLLLILGHYLALNFTGRVGLLGLGNAAWYFTTCGLLLVVPAKEISQNDASERPDSVPASTARHPLAA